MGDGLRDWRGGGAGGLGMKWSYLLLPSILVSCPGRISSNERSAWDPCWGPFPLRSS